MSEMDNIKRLMDDKGVQFRDFRIGEIETRKDGESERLVIRGTPVVFNSETFMFKDLDDYECYEVVEPEALAAADMTDVIFNYNHCGRVFARTRNNTLKLDIDSNGLNMETELWEDDEGHRQLYRDIQRGNIDKMSFAFTVQRSEWEDDHENKKSTRKIKAIDRLFDVSAVDIPAYDATSISARKALQTEREQVQSERQAASKRDKKIAEIRKKILIDKIKNERGIK